MSTARDLIKASLRLIGASASGETPSAEESTEGLSSLNDMIESWSNEDLLIPSITREVFPLSASTRRYSMGASGDFNTTRPMMVETVLIQESGTNPVSELPMRIMTSNEFASIQVKDTQSTIPTYVWVEYSNPLIYLNFYPVPSEAKNVVIYSQKALSTISNLSTELTFPPGYNRALKYNLALEIAPEYGMQISPDIQRIAMEAKANIKRKHTKPQYLYADAAVLGQGGTFNYLTGDE